MTELATATADTQSGDLSFDEALADEIKQDAVHETITDETPDKPVEDGAEAAAADDEPQEELEEAQDPASEDSEDDPEKDTDDVDEQEADPQEVATLEPPARWDADKKELFETLPTEAKAYIAEREKVLQAEITRRQQETAELRKNVDADANQQNTELANVLKQAKAQFASNYDGITVQQLADYAAQGPEQAAEAQQIQLRAAADEQQIQLLQAEQDKVTAKQQAEFLAEQQKLIPEYLPEMLDPVKGEAFKAELVSYLKANDYTPEQIASATAKDLQTVDKARKYDALMAQKSKAKPAAPKAGKVVKSAAPAKSGSSAQVKLAKMRKASDGSIEAETAIMLLEDELAANS